MCIVRLDSSQIDPLLSIYRIEIDVYSIYYICIDKTGRQIDSMSIYIFIILKKDCLKSCQLAGREKYFRFFCEKGVKQ